MSPRPVPLWRTLIHLAVLAGLGWLAYEFVWVRRMGSAEAPPPLQQDRAEAISDRIAAVFEPHECFVAVRGAPLWRPRERWYRIEILVANGCEAQAGPLCQAVSDMVDREFGVSASVWAILEDGTREIGRYLR